MPIVFVHGVPETAALWDDVRRALGRRDTVALALPGFSNTPPAGFTSTKEAYVEWLIGKLAAFGEPVDLVGHDWGGGFTLRLACVRPDLLRSWVSDAAGMADVQFEWHEFAKVWQTPEAGEAFLAEQLAAPLEQRAMGFEALGVPPARARQMAAGVDATMVTSILALYRSATTVSSEWGPPVDGLRIPGLVIVPENDPFLVGETAVRTAQRCHAQLVRFDGVGHWWPVEAPARGAEVLARFWSSLQ